MRSTLFLRHFFSSTGLKFLVMAIKYLLSLLTASLPHRPIGYYWRIFRRLAMTSYNMYMPYILQTLFKCEKISQEMLQKDLKCYIISKTWLDSALPTRLQPWPTLTNSTGRAIKRQNDTSTKHKHIRELVTNLKPHPNQTRPDLINDLPSHI